MRTLGMVLILDDSAIIMTKSTRGAALKYGRPAGAQVKDRADVLMDMPESRAR